MALVAPALRELQIRDFSGGLNLRDAASELATNESPDLWNVTLDERGGVSKRLGQQKWNSSVYGGGLVQNKHYSDVLSDVVVQAGDKLYLGTGTTAKLTFSTSARAGFCDFNGLVWAVHPADGVYHSSDGSTWTAVASSPKGTAIVPWQGRLITVGDPGNPRRVSGSAIGDGTDWATTAGHGWTNDIHEGESNGLVGIAAASNEDVQGRAGLIVCKNAGAFRLYDADTGFYTVMSPTVGMASSLSATNIFGWTILLSERGIFQTDGVGTPKPVAEQLAPLWDDTAIAFDQAALFCAGSKGDRAYFSMPRAGSTANDLALEYHPSQGWFVAGSNAASCYTTYSLDEQRLLAGSPSVSGQVYEQQQTGADDGTDIASWFQTRWFLPNSGIKSRLRQVRVTGRGTFDLYRRADYETGVGLHRDITIPAGGFTWNDFRWNDGSTWGPSRSQNFDDAFSLGVARAVSFRVQETSSLTKVAPKLLSGGAGQTVGAWALYGIDLQHIPLGTA